MAQDLIILGSPQLSMVSWLLDISVVRRVAIESQCPVIVIRPTIQATTEYLKALGNAGVTLAYYSQCVERVFASNSTAMGRVLR